MRVIISHQNLDFDGLASMVAASKLYPDATMAYAGVLSHEVKGFVSLYKNILSIDTAGKLDFDDIKELIIVDVNSHNRIGKFKELIQKDIPILIYDHHDVSDRTIDKAEKKIFKYGACITILLKEIIEKGIKITPFEATLFALGIYADTHCLTLNHTTYHDAEAVAFLLKAEANLEIINEFLSTNMDSEQDQLFTQLLLKVEIHEINGYEIALAAMKSDFYIGQLGTMCEKILEFKNTDAAFMILEAEGRSNIVARSTTDEIHIPNILESFGGGGHLRAGSAAVKNLSLEDAKNQLMHHLKEKIEPQATAKDIMNYPVKTVFEDMTVEEVNKIMFRYGHTGMPVVKEDKLIGIISRTDIDKAMIHGLNHAPVKGFMRTSVMTISPTTTISEINDILINHNIGRVPVVEDGKIIGIVTRTDILRVLHGKNPPAWYHKTYTEEENTLDCSGLLHKLPKEIYEILDIAGRVGDDLNIKTYVVGGFVRDLILETENWDIDLMVEGDGIAFAEVLNTYFEGQLKLYHKFGTALITLENGQSIDIVTARREYYEYPAALPKIEKSSIWSDLFRRDFTINCMAIQLNKREEGKLIDYFGGLADIKNRKIRVLYNLSFIEDPTRIFRAIRFAARFNYGIEEETQNFIQQAITQGMIAKLSTDRIRDELLYIIREKSLLNSLLIMEDLGILKGIHPDLGIDDGFAESYSKIEDTLSQFKGVLREPNPVLLTIMLMLSNFPKEKLDEVIGLFSINKAWANIIYISLSNRNEVYTKLREDNLDKYQLYKILHALPEESIIYYYTDCKNPYIRHYLMFFSVKLRDIKTFITGEDLLKLGIKPGPSYTYILQEVLKAKVEGNIYTIEDELKLAKDFYESLKGE
ncbi:CBS domain-containing protein [Alkaliphilus serpentinus]|uniref:CBS domain-containing protein n=1 Tax=Alkaliphilus serpentinus TaxID=1482731 RepID=A0A833HM61_9FIRM|nr:CBS domain-containing protein [Alkaliphilus serpentinus]KAB3527369.1 CBS domain-containing protein [Alkaliphilus serpentinus]